MLKPYIVLILATVFLALNVVVGSATAANVSEQNRTIPINESGETTTITQKEYVLGKRLFVDTCSQCHGTGMTKTNPNVGLGVEAMAGAEPPRNNLAALVDYMQNPTTYDGEIEIYELHPSTRSADIFPEMRNLSDEDLEAIGSYILVEMNVRPNQWGAGKNTR
jgi:photosystem II cytochrome c550